MSSWVLYDVFWLGHMIWTQSVFLNGSQGHKLLLGILVQESVDILQNSRFSEKFVVTKVV
jgi:hypothetical protein